MPFTWACAAATENAENWLSLCTLTVNLLHIQTHHCLTAHHPNLPYALSADISLTD